MTVELVGPWPKELQSSVSKVVQVLDGYQEIDLPEGAINIMLVDDKEIARLNEEYSGNAYPTDVLTFAYAEEEVEDGELADIAISLDTAKRQAEEAGVKLEEEIALLSLHGILHAIGFDHQTESDIESIDEVQADILKQSGINYREFKWEH